MGFESCVFRFIFKNELSNNRIVTKLLSFNASYQSPENDQLFREKFSCILEFPEVFNLNKKIFESGGQKLTILYGSFYENSFLHSFLYGYLEKKINYYDYSDKDCNISFYFLNASFAHRFISFLYVFDKLEIKEILNSISHKLTDNEYALFQTGFLSFQEKLITLRTKLSQAKPSESDLINVINYFNLTKLLQREFFLRNTINPSDYDPFVDSLHKILVSDLIENDYISNSNEIKQFFDFSLYKQLEVSKRWLNNFQSRLTSDYSWDELFFIISVLSSIIKHKSIFFDQSWVKDELRIKQDILSDLEMIEYENSLYKDVLTTNLQGKRFLSFFLKPIEMYIDQNNIISSFNFNHLNKIIGYSIDIINEFLFESKKLIPDCFNSLIESIYQTNVSDDTIEYSKTDDFTRIVNKNLEETIVKYKTENILQPSTVTISTIFSGYDSKEITYNTTRLLQFLPDQVINELEEKFLILRSANEYIMRDFNQKINPFWLINDNYLKNLRKLVELEEFLDNKN